MADYQEDQIAMQPDSPPVMPSYAPAMIQQQPDPVAAMGAVTAPAGYAQQLQRMQLAPEDQAAMQQYFHNYIQSAQQQSAMPEKKSKLGGIGMGLLGVLGGRMGQQLVQSAQQGAQQQRLEEQQREYGKAATLRNMISLQQAGVFKPIVQAAAAANKDAKTQADAENNKAKLAAAAAKLEWEQGFKTKQEGRRQSQGDSRIANQSRSLDMLDNYRNQSLQLRKSGLDAQADRFDALMQDHKLARDWQGELQARAQAAHSGIVDKEGYIRMLGLKNQIQQFNQTAAAKAAEHNDLMDKLEAQKGNDGEPLYKDFKAADHHIEVTPLDLPDLDVRNFPGLLGTTQAPQAAPAPMQAHQAAPAAMVRRIARPAAPAGMIPPPPNTGPPITPQTPGGPHLVAAPAPIAPTPAQANPPQRQAQPNQMQQRLLAKFQALPPEDQKKHQASFQAAMQKYSRQ